MLNLLAAWVWLIVEAVERTLYRKHGEPDLDLVDVRHNTIEHKQGNDAQQAKAL